MADIDIFFPETRLPKASVKTMVMVEPEVLSTDKEANDTEIVETLADTAPGVNTNVAVFVSVMPSVVSVAEMVFVSALVDLIVAVV